MTRLLAFLLRLSDRDDRETSPLRANEFDDGPCFRVYTAMMLPRL